MKIQATELEPGHVIPWMGKPLTVIEVVDDAPYVVARTDGMTEPELGLSAVYFLPTDAVNLWED